MGPSKKLISILTVFILLSCRTGPKINAKDAIAETEPDSLKVLIDRTNSSNEKDKELNFEYILIDSVKFNKISFRGEKDLLDLTLKMADSINEYGYECGSALQERNSIYYSLKDEIEVSNDKYAYRVVHFNSKKETEISYKGINFNSNYTLDDFQKDFPISYKNNSDYEGQTVEIHVASNTTFDNDVTWRFYFSNGDLLKLWYFISC